MIHAIIIRGKHSLLTVLILILTSSCAYQLGSLENPGQGFNLVPQTMEIQMGLEAADEIEAEERLLSDTYVQSYINQLGQRLVQSSRRPDIAYQFKVIDTDEMNAFALPGGFIYINRGLIEAAESEAELAGVIAHEIGHVTARHGAKRMTKQILLQIGFAAFSAMSDHDRDTQMKLLIANAIATGFLLKNSRDNERQADDLGTENLYRAGYDPISLAHFFDTLGQKHSPSALETFFSTHPSPGERIRNVQMLIATFPPQTYMTDSPEFQYVKQQLTGKPSVASHRRPQQQPQYRQRVTFRRQGLRRKASGMIRRQ